jgi:hypothetical protein
VSLKVVFLVTVVKDEWRMTHLNTLTCSPLKQRQTFDHKLGVRFMAFIRLD